MPSVQAGPFAGMNLTPITTGSDAPKRLGSYEAELHPLIESWRDYDTIVDVGCGEGWYVVGLARRMPAARVFGFDISRKAQRACRAMAAANGVNVDVSGAATPETLASLVSGRTLIIVDAEGAEVDVLDPEVAPAMLEADILVEMHDFARPGATGLIRERFARHNIVEIRQEARQRSNYPAVERLRPDDRTYALSEFRDANQIWLWIEANRDA